MDIANIIDCKYGSKQVIKIYIGDKLIWEKN